MHLPTPLTLLLIALLSPLVSAQFGFFDQMFGGGGQQQQQGEPQNVPSDPTFYQSNWERMRCDKYLCPDTLGMSSSRLLRLLSPFVLERT